MLDIAHHLQTFRHLSSTLQNLLQDDGPRLCKEHSKFRFVRLKYTKIAEVRILKALFLASKAALSSFFTNFGLKFFSIEFSTKMSQLSCW